MTKERKATYESLANIMKIGQPRFWIVLDIDGVLVPYPRWRGDIEEGKSENFKRSAMVALNSLIVKNKASLLMVSGWNSKVRSVEEYEDLLVRNGMVNIREFGGRLLLGDQHNRYEMTKVLIENEALIPGKFIIVDDEAYGYYYKTDHLVPYLSIVRPNRYRCLDEFDTFFAQQCIKEDNKNAGK